RRGMDAHPLQVNGTRYPAGTFYVRRGGGPRRMRPARTEAPIANVHRSPLGGLAPMPSARGEQRGGVDASLACRPSIDVIPRTERLSRLPRIALYKPWTASMDEGWTRWVFDQHDVPYITLTDSMVNRGRLRDQFDVVLVPDMSLRE